MSSPGSVDVLALGEVCERYGIAELAVFGSAASGRLASGSDVDVLYVLRDGVHLGWAINDLADDLGRCWRGRSTSWPSVPCTIGVRDAVLAEAQVLYAA